MPDGEIRHQLFSLGTPTSLTIQLNHLADGRTIAVPVDWYPRLRHGSARERANYMLGRNGIHWPDLDEDIAVAGLLNGERSSESLASIRRWLDQRCKRGVGRKSAAATRKSA